MVAAPGERDVACEPHDSRSARITIRIQLGAMPEMLGEIVVALLGAREAVEVVGRCHEGEDALDAAHRTHADLLVVREAQGALHALGNHAQPAPDCISRIFANPGLAIMAISDDAAAASVVRLEPRHMTLDGDHLAALSASLKALH